MKKGMRVVGSVQEESLWKINGKEQVTCENCLVSTNLFFPGFFFFLTAWDQKEKIHALQPPTQILLHQ